MVKKQWKIYVFWVVFCVAVGALSGFLSADATAQYGALAIKPPLSPPSWVFPVVWTVLFILMGISVARIWMLKPSKRRGKALNLFFAQLIVNFFWPLLFFNAQAYGFAFLWLILLWILVLEKIWNYWWLDNIAAKLQFPYIIWLSFAAYLNLFAAILN